MPKPILVIQGAQWGSEAKGMVAAALCQRLDIDYAVRTGAINAGHTVYHNGVAYKMQQLPTGWVNPDTKLVIGPGALVNPQTLQNEIAAIDKAQNYDEQTCESITERLLIDYRSGYHGQEHADRSHVSGRHHAIGATGKGCSEALVERVSGRGKAGRLFRDIHSEQELVDTVAILNRAYDEDRTILLEGTQGSHLDLYLGPYPYTTHKPCQASNWLVESGLSPSLEYEVVLVVRSYPIRVAGNSGPMPREISWTNLAARINTRLMQTQRRWIVSGESLLAWEEAQRALAMSGKFNLPKVGGQAWYNFEDWDPTTRLDYKGALSEFHAAAWKLLTPEIQEDLSSLFEFTTVTKKLRRVAELDWDILHQSVMWNRPKYCVLTFANYLWPEIWGTTDMGSWPSATIDAFVGFQMEFQQKLGVPIRYISTGPLSEHLLEVEC